MTNYRKTEWILAIFLTFAVLLFYLSEGSEIQAAYNKIINGMVWLSAGLYLGFRLSSYLGSKK